MDSSDPLSSDFQNEVKSLLENVCTLPEINWKNINLVSEKILTNILNNPTDPKLRDLNYTKLSKKFNSSSYCLQLLYLSGFTPSQSRLLLTNENFNLSKITYIKNQLNCLQKKINDAKEEEKKRLIEEQKYFLSLRQKEIDKEKERKRKIKEKIAKKKLTDKKEIEIAKKKLEEKKRMREAFNQQMELKEQIETTFAKNLSQKMETDEEFKNIFNTIMNAFESKNKEEEKTEEAVKDKEKFDELYDKLKTRLKELELDHMFNEEQCKKAVQRCIDNPNDSKLEDVIEWLSSQYSVNVGNENKNEEKEVVKKIKLKFGENEEPKPKIRLHFVKENDDAEKKEMDKGEETQESEKQVNDKDDNDTMKMNTEEPKFKIHLKFKKDE